MIYSLDIIRTVANMFEKQEGETVLAAVKDQRGRVHLQALKDKIIEQRTSAHQWLHIKEFAQMSPGPGKKTSISPNTTNSNGHSSKSFVVCNFPRDDPDCSVCQNLESNGDTHSLYGNHHSNFAIGCPRYIMLNPDYRWKRQDKDYKCETISINNKKSQLRFHGDYSKLRPVEKGEPVFLLSMTEGKTRPLLNLWD